MSISLVLWPIRTSFLSRRDPRWRLAAFSVGLMAVALSHRFGPIAVGMGFALTLAWMAGVSRRLLLPRLLIVGASMIPFVLVVPFISEQGEVLARWGRLSITDHGLWLAATLLLQSLTLVTLAMTVLATAPLATTLAAAGRMGVPRLLVQLTLLTHRYVFVLMDELARLRTALRVRGFRNAMNSHAYRTVGQVAGTLIVRGSDRGERVAQAMRCRGFEGRFRTMQETRTSASDVLMFLAIAGAFAALVLWDRLA